MNIFFQVVVGLFFIILGYGFFFHGKIWSDMQGQEEGDWPEDVYVRKLKVGAIFFFILGLYLIIRAIRILF